MAILSTDAAGYSRLMAAAMRRAQTLAGAALGDAAFTQARAEGATLRDAEIAARAFGSEDA